MEDKKKEILENEKTEPVQLEANICFSGSTCGTCHYFDTYHGGYCNCHHVDIQSYHPTCADYWPER